MGPRLALDGLGRGLSNLRLSVTDRCNLRCAYCMPEEQYSWLPSRDILSFEEISALVDVFRELGVNKVRLTGGEPLLRHDVHRLVELLARKPLDDLALTTNGLLLPEQARALKAAGLHRLTVSLDTLRAARFRELTRSDAHRRVLEGIGAALAAGLGPGLKLDTVVMRGVNEDELFDLLDYAREIGAEIRFIEYMDVGGATRWSMSQVVSRAEMLAAISHRYGGLQPLAEASHAPAERFRLPDGTVFGLIASTTSPFCRSCDRSRLTADGHWYLCLYAQAGVDLKHPLRAGAGTEELKALIARGWAERTERGAEMRLRMREKREAFLSQAELRDRPHLEMHTRGG